MRDPMPRGSLRHVLLPQTFGRHQTHAAEFTVLSVETWTTSVVINIEVAGISDSPPRIVVEDHLGTAYSLESSETLGSRNLQIFTPSVPPATRSLTIRSIEDGEASLVVTVAVPPVTGPADPEAVEPAHPDGA
jgi:hypothetical protein